jgi:hypothetical protein
MKVQNSVSKSSYLPDQKSICEQYGLYLTNPARKRKKKPKDFRGEKGRKYKARYTSMFLELTIMSQKISGSKPYS